MYLAQIGQFYSGSFNPGAFYLLTNNATRGGWSSVALPVVVSGTSVSGLVAAVSSGIRG